MQYSKLGTDQYTTPINEIMNGVGSTTSLQSIQQAAQSFQQPQHVVEHNLPSKYKQALTTNYNSREMATPNNYYPRVSGCVETFQHIDTCPVCSKLYVCDNYLLYAIIILLCGAVVFLARKIKMEA